MGVRELPPFLHSVSAPRGARASPVPFRGSYFASDCIPPTRRPKGSSSACTGAGVVHSWHQCASWRTQIEEPVCGGYSSALHFHATLPRMLGPPLIGHQILQVCQSREKRLLAAIGMMEPRHRE
jgi:hypothetical protein